MQRTTQTEVDRRCGRRFKEAWCEKMDSENIGQRGMGINYKEAKAKLKGPQHYKKKKKNISS